MKAHLVACNGVAGAIEDDEARRGSALVDTTHEPLLLVLGVGLAEVPGEILLVIGGHGAGGSSRQMPFFWE